MFFYIIGIGYILIGLLVFFGFPVSTRFVEACTIMAMGVLMGIAAKLDDRI